MTAVESGDKITLIFAQNMYVSSAGL